MAVETDIFQCIKGLCGNRAFRDFAPMNTVKPYVTFVQVGGEGMATVAGVSSLQHGRFQFNVWGDGRDSVSTLMKQIESSLIAATAFTARPIGARQNSYEPDMLLYGSMQDFSVFSPR